MNSYLELAEKILRAERRPLSARSILASAFRLGIVPEHLFGKTQHKTLGARISEDIVQRREKSPFFRQATGKFFLREFLQDKTIPEKYRREFPTRRRVRELMRGPALAFNSADIAKLAGKDGVIAPRAVFHLLENDKFLYDDPKNRRSDSVFLWSFVSIWRRWDLLSYRLGRYRDDRDTFNSRRCVGFSTLVRFDEQTLFNRGDYGIVDAGVRAAKIDLDIAGSSFWEGAPAKRVTLPYFVWSPTSRVASDLLAVVNLDCPDEFEPLKRRLALNDLQWLDSRLPVNNLDDFDPWSKAVLGSRHLERLTSGL